MTYDSIEREIEVHASPEVVFEVVSRPEHIRQWWPDDARFEPTVGAPGELVWRNAETGDTMTVALAVVAVDPPRRFAFRWCFPEADPRADALLVTFDLAPTAAGTRVRMTETGFRGLPGEVAAVEEQYNEHETGWDHYLPLLGSYVARLVAAR